MELSIIVTGHSEGLIAHKTILSLFESLKRVPKISYEIIVHLDCCNKDTREYFSRYENDKRFRIFENSFGDLGLSRNYAIKQAHGKYIQIIDADDIIASHHIERAFAEVRKHHDDDALYYPEFVYYFGDEYKVKIQKSIENKRDCAKALLVNNAWCSMVFGKKKLFLQTPYSPTKNGYGHEDWIFNTRTAAKDIPHRILPQIALFYRRNGFSLCQRNISKNVAQPESQLFDFSFFKSLNLVNNEEAPHKSPKDTLLSFYKSLRNRKTINFFISPLATVAKKVSGVKLIHEQSDTYIRGIFLNDIRLACELDNSILPKDCALNRLIFFYPSCPNNALECYLKIANNINDKKIDYIFLVPWIETGGADKVILNYLDALYRLYPDKNVLVLSTAKSKNSSRNKVPENTMFADFEKISSNLSLDHADTLLTRIILQTKCKRIHIVNSMVGYNWVYNHSELLTADEYIITASFFAREVSGNYNGALRHSDFADPYIMRIDKQLDAIFTDNSKIVPYLTDQCGIKEEKIFVHYQPCIITPTNSTNLVTTKSQRNEVYKILWASRVCSAKNPELLLRIANSPHLKKCEIHVFGKLCQPYDKSIFKKHKNISYHGEYDGIESIAPSEYDCFLYTSKADGLPNVILEIAQYNIPIIASRIGGIEDFIADNDTGILISDTDNEKEYVEKINLLRNNKNLSISLARNAKKLVEKRHSEESFTETISKSF